MVECEKKNKIPKSYVNWHDFIHRVMNNILLTLFTIIIDAKSNENCTMYIS